MGFSSENFTFALRVETQSHFMSDMFVLVIKRSDFLDLDVRGLGTASCNSLVVS